MLQAFEFLPSQLEDYFKSNRLKVHQNAELAENQLLAAVFGLGFSPAAYNSCSYG